MESPYNGEDNVHYISYAIKTSSARNDLHIVELLHKGILLVFPQISLAYVIEQGTTWCPTKSFMPSD